MGGAHLTLQCRSKPILVLAAPERSQPEEGSEATTWIARQITWQRRLLDLSRAAERRLAEEAYEEAEASVLRRAG
jgi:hypothetical protein